MLLIDSELLYLINHVYVLRNSFLVELEFLFYTSADARFRCLGARIHVLRWLWMLY